LLTWAFFLAEIAGRDAFLPTAAHAADEDVRATSHAIGDSAPVVNALPNAIDVSSADVPQPGDEQLATVMARLTPSHWSNSLAEPNDGNAGDADTEGQGHGGGGIGQASDAEAAIDADASFGGKTLRLGMEQPLDGDSLGHLDFDGLHSLELGVGDLGLLPDVGDLLGGLGDAVSSTTNTLFSTLNSALAPVVSIIGLGGDAEPSGSVASPGMLDFGQGAPSAPDDLIAHGNYTDYGIALNLGPVDALLNPAHADASDATPVSALLDHVLHDSDSGSDALHLDQALIRIAGDALS
jgi:hypothetical protein